MVIYGCAAQADSSSRGTATLPVANHDAERRSTGSPPAAIVNGRAVTWAELRPLLNERAGAEILQEVILDRLVHDAAAAAGITVTNEDVEAERERLLESLSDDRDTALRLLAGVRDRQGLGRARFEALLRRNAAHRALVSHRNEVEITEADVRQIHEITYGAKRQGRLIVVPDLLLARTSAQRISNGEGFADVAVEVSTDASATRGGLLEPISRADPSYPEALRTALWRLSPNEISPPILLEGQYALVTLVREVPAQDVNIDDVRPQLMRHARLMRERMAMDQLARRLMADVSITIFDDALNDAWKRRQGGRGRN